MNKGWDALQELVPDYVAPAIEYKPLRRYTAKGERFYYELEGEDIIPYISVTSLGGMVIAKEFGYEEWLMANSYNAEFIRIGSAVFGSLFHKEAMKPIIGDPIHKHGYNFDWLLQEAPGEFVWDENSFRPATNFDMMVPFEWRHKASEWVRPFKMGMLSWLNFLSEKVEEVLAIEIPLRSKTLRVAGTIDLIHRSPYRGKSRICQTDIKSFLFSADDMRKSKSFYKVHQFQLEVNKRIWNENYPDFAIDESQNTIFNWRPNNWKKEVPTYDWKYQGDNDYNGKKRTHIGTFDSIDLSIAYAQASGLISFPREALDVVGEVEDFRNMDYSKNIHKIKIN